MTTQAQEIKVVEVRKITDLPKTWRGYPKALYTLADAVKAHLEKTGMTADTVYSYEAHAIRNWIIERKMEAEAG